MPGKPSTLRRPEVTLFGYAVSSDTQVALVANPPTQVGMLIIAAVSVVLVVSEGLKGVLPAMLFSSIVAVILSFPKLVLVAIEQDGILTVRRSAFGRQTSSRIPFTEILRVERGNEYFRADLTIVQRGHVFHDITLITKGRGAHPRFHHLFNQTELPFPENPQTHPYEIAEMLCSLLATRGVTIRAEETSLSDHLVWSIFRPWKLR